MKYCSHCGKELFDEAVLCPGCGCEVGSKRQDISTTDAKALLVKLSEKEKTNGVIWLIIGILQILGGIFINWWMIIVGVLNIVSSINDINFSKTVLANQSGIVKRYEPLTGPIITLVYNLVIGGVIGVIGSIYYFVAIRNFVMENKATFESLDNEK